MSWLNSFNYYAGKKLIDRIRLVILENYKDFMKY